MHLHLLFLMQKPAALYMVSIKSYSKKILVSIHRTGTHANETDTIEMLLL